MAGPMENKITPKWQRDLSKAFFEASDLGNTTALARKAVECDGIVVFGDYLAASDAKKYFPSLQACSMRRLREKRGENQIVFADLTVPEALLGTLHREAVAFKRWRTSAYVASVVAVVLSNLIQWAI